MGRTKEIFAEEQERAVIEELESIQVNNQVNK